MSPPAEATTPDIVIDNPPKIDSAAYQALIRAARYIGATLISAVVVVLPQLVGVFELDPAITGFLVLFLGGVLQGLGKFLRGPSIDVGPGQIVAGGAEDVPQTVSSTPGVTDKLPF